MSFWVKMEEKIKTLSVVTNQLVLRNLGLYGGSALGNDIYFLIEAINLLISEVGEEWISEKYKESGKDWEKMKKKLLEINELSTLIKIFYDSIQDKKFEKKKVDENKVQSMFKKYFRTTSMKMALLQRDLYDLFVFLVKNTSIRNASIPPEAFKVIEHIGRSPLDLTKRPERK